MGQITLKREDALRVLNNPESGPDARAIAGVTMALFEVSEHAEDIEKSTKSIVLKVVHMVATAIYDLDEG